MTIDVNGNPLSTVAGAAFRGQPVYRQWNEDRTCSYFSREIRALPGGGWKFVRWVPITEADVHVL